MFAGESRSVVAFTPPKVISSSVILAVLAGALVPAEPASAPGRGAYTVLHSFSGGTDGSSPAAALIQAADGNFYGTTASGGASDFGTVFRMTPAGTVLVLHAFVGGTADGSNPQAALVQATDGNFYGTTYSM